MPHVLTDYPEYVTMTRGWLIPNTPIPAKPQRVSMTKGNPLLDIP